MLFQRFFQGNKPKCWNTIDTIGSGFSTVCPSMRISPPFSWFNPPTQRSKVVLPQPDGPTMLTISALPTLRLKSSSTGSSP